MSRGALEGRPTVNRATIRCVKLAIGASGTKPGASRRISKTYMPAFTNPGFQERQAAAANARGAALAKFLARPPVDEALMAARAARRQAREAAEAEKRAAARRAREEAEAAKREQERQAAAAAEAAIKAPPMPLRRREPVPPPARLKSGSSGQKRTARLRATRAMQPGRPARDDAEPALPRTSITGPLWPSLHSQPAGICLMNYSPVLDRSDRSAANCNLHWIAA